MVENELKKNLNKVVIVFLYARKEGEIKNLDIFQ